MNFYFFLMACAQRDPAFTVISAQAAPPAVSEDSSAVQEDTSENVEVLEDIKAAAAQSTAQENRATCIERFLMDQLAMKEGKTPKGWVQPPFEEYCKPGAPITFIPAPSKPPVVTTTTKR